MTGKTLRVRLGWESQMKHWDLVKVKTSRIGVDKQIITYNNKPMNIINNINNRWFLSIGVILYIEILFIMAK